MLKPQNLFYYLKTVSFRKEAGRFTG